MLVGDGQIVAVGPGLTAQYPGATIRDCSGLVIWLRLDGRARTRIPAHAAYDSIDEAPLKILQGVPYTWPVGAPRRVENFVDLAHFAWVHDGSLGRRDEPVPPMPSVARQGGELRFSFDPPEMEVDETALFGHSEYRRGRTGRL